MINLDKKVSILIPVFNSELYLHSCIKSVLNQTYTNLEIIIVDDGSFDDSANICEYYSSLDTRIKVFHKSNEGISKTRNFCLEKANGEYVCFIDSDDIIHPQMIEKLVSNILTYKCEISICAFDKFDDEMNINLHQVSSKSIVLTSDEVKRDFFLNKKIGFANWNKLYRSNIAKNIVFEDIVLGEDYLYNSEYFKMVNKAVFIDTSLYFYRNTYNSLSNINRFDEVKMDNQIYSREKAYNNFINTPAEKYAKNQYLLSVLMAMIWSIKQDEFTNNDSSYIKYRKLLKAKSSIFEYLKLSKKRFLQAVACVYFPTIMRLKL